MNRSFWKLALAVALSTVNAQAAPTVTLLTSIVSPKPAWYQPASWDINTQLAADFRKAFANSGYQVVVKQGASATDLADALRSPENVGVFWLSHAASDSSSHSALGDDNVVLDQYGVDVQNVFQLVHPNLKWLAVIGCESSPILSHFIKEGIYKDSPSLTIEDYSTTIDAEQGLIYALNASAKVLGINAKTSAAQTPSDDTSDDAFSSIPSLVATPALLAPASSSCPETDSAIPFKIQRSIPANSQASEVTEAQILLGDRLIAVLPITSPGATQSVTVNLPIALIQAQEATGLSITVSSGIAAIPSVKPVIGNFSFSGQLGQWTLFADPAGDPIGVTSHIYAQSGSLSALSGQTLPVLGCSR